MENIVSEIQRLKKERNAVILAHNYVDGAVQDIADFVGDSLELSIRAKECSAPVIVFCGVSFMAETAKILSPNATVLLPAPHAGCPMADMADAKDVADYKKNNPDTVLVAYVNTTAAVKAEVDICVTSANAERIVQSIDPERKIMFLPDQNLAANVSKNLQREMALWPGFCPTHHRMMPEAVMNAREKYPNAKIIVHPECSPAIVALADASLSTGGMLRYVKESDATEFVIGTECGIIHRMQKENPEKKFYPFEPSLVCPNMKKITLENVLESLQYMQHDVQLSPELIERARKPIDEMLAR